MDTTEDVFRDIQLRLYQKGVTSTDGYVGRQFDEGHFFRDPMVLKARTLRELQREFHLRLLRWEDNWRALAHKKGDDLFIVGANRYTGLDTKDVCVELLESSSVKEIAFITGVNQAYE